MPKTKTEKFVFGDGLKAANPKNLEEPVSLSFLIDESDGCLEAESDVPSPIVANVTVGCLDTCVLGVTEFAFLFLVAKVFSQKSSDVYKVEGICKQMSVGCSFYGADIVHCPVFEIQDAVSATQSCTLDRTAHHKAVARRFLPAI